MQRHTFRESLHTGDILIGGDIPKVDQRGPNSVRLTYVAIYFYELIFALNCKKLYLFII